VEDLHASGASLWFWATQVVVPPWEDHVPRCPATVSTAAGAHSVIRKAAAWPLVNFCGEEATQPHVEKPHCSQAAMFVDHETTSEYLNVDLNLVWSTLPRGHRRLPMYSNVEIFHELNTSSAARSWAMNFLGHSLDWVHVPGFQTQKQYTPKQSLICYHKKYM